MVNYGPKLAHAIVDVDGKISYKKNNNKDDNNDNGNNNNDNKPLLVGQSNFTSITPLSSTFSFSFPS